MVLDKAVLIMTVSYLLVFERKFTGFIINDNYNNYESLYGIKHFNFRLAFVNAYPVVVASELLLSTDLPTSEGWTAELTVGLWLVVLTWGFKPT